MGTVECRCCSFSDEDPSVRFFLMRSRWLYNIEVAMKYNMWATRPHNEAVLKSTAAVSLEYGVRRDGTAGTSLLLTTGESSLRAVILLRSTQKFFFRYKKV